MVTHMKTTIDIADSLLAEAKSVAAREGTTVKSLIEEGLRLAMARRGQGGPFSLRPRAFGATASVRMCRSNPGRTSAA